ncbi:hypothetical protein GWI33_000500, partial [Rhynchophorus ferrugineus]
IPSKNEFCGPEHREDVSHRSPPTVPSPRSPSHGRRDCGGGGYVADVDVNGPGRGSTNSGSRKEKRNRHGNWRT